MSEAKLSLLEGLGIEIEYMVVANGSIDVRPIVDMLMKSVSGNFVEEIERGPIAWSNELALHVLEFKTNGPVASLNGVAAQFQENVSAANQALEPLGARLLPTAMHPLMDPFREMRLWPHEYNAIYEAFDRIFDCRGHGWANLQSMHINLSFGNDDEFAKLHAAVRLILPILPALAASSPLRDGVYSGLRDTRLDVYRHNADRVPEVAGRVIPEPEYSRKAYEQNILSRIYRGLEPHDPNGVLRFEWANARGAIARFDRSAIEIRVLDTQEHPGADLAIASLIVAVIRDLVDEKFASLDKFMGWGVDELVTIFDGCVADADEYNIENEAYCALFDAPEGSTAGQLWKLLAERVGVAQPELTVIFNEGTLSRRISRALGSTPSRHSIEMVYGELASCLAEGRAFRA